MNGKLGKVYLSICVICSCAIVAILLFADYKGIFRKASLDDGSVISEERNRQQEQDASFCQKDESLPTGVMQVSLPFEARAGDVTENVSATGTGVTRITVSKKNAVWPDETRPSLTDWLCGQPIRENLSEGDAGLEITETDDVLMIDYAAEQLYACDVEVLRQADAGKGGSILQIELQSACEKYDRLVVLDAGHGGRDTGITADDLSEKDLTLAVVLKAGALLEEQGIKVYYTRMDDETIADDDRAKLANLLHADMLVSVHAAQDEDSSHYGMKVKYNNTFFTPDFSSADLSNILLEKAATGTNEKALGIEADTQEIVVQRSQVPAALLEIGYMSNAQECKLLKKEDYLDRIAQGICNALVQSFEEMSK